MLRRGVAGVLLRPLFSGMVKEGLKNNIFKKGIIVCNYRYLVFGDKSAVKPGLYNQVYKYHAEKKNLVKFLKCIEVKSNNVGDLVELHGKILCRKEKHSELKPQKDSRLNFILKDKSGSIKLILMQNEIKEMKEWLKTKRCYPFVKLTGLVQIKGKHKDDTESNKFSLAVLVKDIISFSTHFKYLSRGQPLSTSSAGSDPSDVHSDNLPPLLNQQSENGLNLKLLPEELSRCSPSTMHYFFQRSHNCAVLNERMVGKNVTLCGWVHTIHGDNAFTLKDGYGSVLVNHTGEVENITDDTACIEVNDLVLVKGVVSSNSEPLNHEDRKKHAVQVSAKVLKVIRDSSNESCRKYTVMQDDPATCASYNKGNNFDNGITQSENIEKINTSPDFNRYTLRSHNCGEIKESLLGQTVHIMGWALYIRMNKFVLLRDKYGTIQVIVPDTRKDLQNLLVSLLPESVISVTGKVTSRPRGLENKFMKSGIFEVTVEDMQIINKSSPLPIHSKSAKPAKSVLMKYRYLDLRHNLAVQKSLQMRCDVLHKMRKFLVEDMGFLEVETPTLFRRTPGGAQEFIVPTRCKGEFYSLVQSPQQFKQLLMVGGIDRYFQIARCYRDETGQRDRQPEFTQLDIEMSFCNREGVLNLIEDLIKYIWPRDIGGLVTPFRRLTFEEAMATYGSDKPDTRFDCKISDLTDVFQSHRTELEKKEIYTYLKLSDFAAHVFVVRNENSFEGSLEKLIQEKKDEMDLKIFSLRMANHEKFNNVLTHLFCDSVAVEFRKRIQHEPGDYIVIGLGAKYKVLKALGEAREIVGNTLNKDDINMIEKHGFHFIWILDFPLFESVGGQLKSVHHPFTQPHPDDVHMLHTEPHKVRGLHYDLVLNGSEVGGGSIRIHDSALQKEILENFLKLDVSSLKHLLEALDSGAPNHGGFALGIDRFIALLCRLSNINDVIAFPKSNTGRDAMSGAPCQISDEDRALYHIGKLDNDVETAVGTSLKRRFRKKFWQEC